jgi:hypothetical protein
MNARRLGLFCMLGGIAYIISAIHSSITGIDEMLNLPNTLLGMVWALGAICGWFAFIQLRGMGDNIIVRFLSFLPIIGLSLTLISTVYGLVTAGTVTFTTLFAIGSMLEVGGAVLVGIFAIAARRLSGWHRFTPFFVVLGVVQEGLLLVLRMAPSWAFPCSSVSLIHFSAMLFGRKRHPWLTSR